MQVKDVVTTVSDYKETGLLVAFPKCTFKCCKETNFCQNSELTKQENIEIDVYNIVKMFNPEIHKALIFGGLEPLDSYVDMMLLIEAFRGKYNRPVIIYTGFTEKEVESTGAFAWFNFFGNIIVKYGRYVPNEKSHFDEVLGVNLASNNQYAVKY